MGPLVGLLLFIGAAVAWAFFSFQPEYANRRALSVFNWTVLGACAMMCLAFVLNIHFFLKNYPPETVKKFAATFKILGALGIESAWLTVMFLVRNFWLFRPRRPRGW